MTDTISREELDAWAKYEIGKPCPLHPDNIIKKGQWGNWCGQRTETGGWCSGGWPTEEWLLNFRKGKI